MALREVIDTNGTHWMVFGVQPSSASHGTIAARTELAQGWLCFQCETERRRIAGIPNGWDAMDDAGLLALLANAPEAPRVPRARRR